MCFGKRLSFYWYQIAMIIKKIHKSIAVVKRPLLRLFSLLPIVQIVHVYESVLRQVVEAIDADAVATVVAP